MQQLNVEERAPTPPSKPSLPQHSEALSTPTSTTAARPSIEVPPSPIRKSYEPSTNGDEYPRVSTPGAEKTASPSGTMHRRSLTVSRGSTVSVVLISSALETIASSREAKRMPALRESTQHALEMVRTGQGGDRPREIFEPLRLACETRNEKLMIASLDCISKLISHSFFVENNPAPPVFHSPPNSPGQRDSSGGPPDEMMPLVDLVVHTITACHSETTPETVSLQIVKALLSLVLSSTILVHHSSLLKAVRTVYNVFLLSTDPVNQMVAQGGLQQMVQHVFGRCKVGKESADLGAEATSLSENGTPHYLATSTTLSEGEAAVHVDDPEILLPSPETDTEARAAPGTNGAHIKTNGHELGHTRTLSL